MYKKNLAPNNLQWFICHKTKLNQNPHSRRTYTHSHVNKHTHTSLFLYIGYVPLNMKVLIFFSIGE